MSNGLNFQRKNFTGLEIKNMINKQLAEQIEKLMEPYSTELAKAIEALHFRLSDVEGAVNSIINKIKTTELAHNIPLSTNDN